MTVDYDTFELTTAVFLALNLGYKRLKHAASSTTATGVMTILHRRRLDRSCINVDLVQHDGWIVDKGME
tara:strand:- start:225 stop:431 length:207 start_codon:yes stop_codon:yes gene_type:complete